MCSLLIPSSGDFCIKQTIISLVFAATTHEQGLKDGGYYHQCSKPSNSLLEGFMEKDLSVLSSISNSTSKALRSDSSIARENFYAGQIGYR